MDSAVHHRSDQVILVLIQLTEDHFIVHALMDVSSSGIIDGTLPGQVAKLYEKKQWK